MRYALVIAVALGGCHLLGGTDDLVIVPPEVDGSTSGSGGATSSATVGSGAAPACTDTLCQETADECQTCACLEGIVCNCDPVAFGQACSTGYCDSDGTCVPCLDNVSYKCVDPLTCLDKTCVAATCSDMIENGGESDIDCGGSCLPCPNGKGCNNPNDCQSHLCSNLLCTPCNMHPECGAQHYCEESICFPQKQTFDECSQDYQCLSNNCVCIGLACGCGF